MLHHPDPLQGILLLGADAALLPGNVDLLLHGNCALQFRRQPLAVAAGDDHDILFMSSWFGEKIGFDQPSKSTLYSKSLISRQYF